MKKLLALGFVVAICATAFHTPAHAGDDADAIFCRQDEFVSVQIPQALEQDALADSKGEESGGDSFYLTLTDTLIGDGSCAELSHTDVVFTAGSQTWCSKTTPDACFVHGAAMAKLPKEAGNRFANGFAIFSKDNISESIVVDVAKGDLEVAPAQSSVMAATAE